MWTFSEYYITSGLGTSALQEDKKEKDAFCLVRSVEQRIKF